ncbi:VOC family protein [Chengkuizengella marina]|uniref:VOC family protein n=1 Tax=Chengkuizengella marina TaxID=2507566 RepID=A0A6N9Q5T4_9BACL|nr:VOC family protein [Chengkuizengella marina]NBI30192.1 VOC family protein [Chengkuizengella marina]
MTLEIAVFLSMNGKANDAISFYKKHLNAKELLLVTYSDMKKSDSSIVLTEENKDYISHSVLQIGKTKLMIAEETMIPNEIYNVGNNISLCIQSANFAEVQSFYNNLISDDRVQIIFPLSKNSFSEAYGIVQDPYGVQIQLMYDTRLK